MGPKISSTSKPSTNSNANNQSLITKKLNVVENLVKKKARVTDGPFYLAYVYFALSHINTLEGGLPPDLTRLITYLLYQICFRGKFTIEKLFGNSTLNVPVDLCCDNYGFLYISDYSNSKVKRFDLNKKRMDSTFELSFRTRGLCIDSDDKLFFVNESEIKWVNIRDYDVNSKIHTLKVSVSLKTPMALAVDNDDQLLLAEFGNYTVRRINSKTGEAKTISGRDSTVGHQFGKPSDSLNGSTYGVCYSTITGNIYFTSYNANCVCMIDANTGETSLIAGGKNGQDTKQSDADGIGREAAFYTPWCICVDKHENVFVCDAYNKKVKVIRYRSDLDLWETKTVLDHKLNTGGPIAGTARGICVDSKTGNIYASIENEIIKISYYY